jgi:hypothetical protein
MMDETMQRAQAAMVSRSLNWELVEERLKKFPKIGALFPSSRMKRYGDKPPYYCHYMAWRLGTWSTDYFFRRMETLLDVAMGLEGWNKKNNAILWVTEYGGFWSLLWELQVASALHRSGLCVEWTAQGPDLLLTTSWGKVYVECYVLQKRFTPVEYLETLLQCAHPSLRVEHTHCVPIDIPSSGGPLDEFLDRTIRPFLNQTWIAELHRKSLTEHVSIPVAGVTNLRICMKGDPLRPAGSPFRSGDSAAYLEAVVRETLANKAKSNLPETCRPRILLANYLVSQDYQSSMHHAFYVPSAVPRIDLNGIYEGVVLCVCGIDRDYGKECIVQVSAARGYEKLVAVVTLRSEDP